MQTKTIKTLKAGDDVVSGLYDAATGIVASVEPARARGYFVVTFTSGKRTSGHGSMAVVVKS